MGHKLKNTSQLQIVKGKDRRGKKDVMTVMTRATPQIKHGCTYGGRYLRSKRTLKKILRLPELKPSITVLTKDSPRTLFL